MMMCLLLITEGGRQIIAERQRQIAAEGWTVEHDEEHDDASLLRADVCYMLNITCPERMKVRPDGVPMMWPWDGAWWKPKGPRAEHVKPI